MMLLMMSVKLIYSNTSRSATLWQFLACLAIVDRNLPSINDAARRYFSQLILMLTLLAWPLRAEMRPSPRRHMMRKMAWR